MTGPIVWEVLFLLVAFGTGVAGVIIALYRVRDDLRNEIRDNRHTLRNEMQREAATNDSEFTAIEKRLGDLERDVAWLKAKLNGKH